MLNEIQDFLFAAFTRAATVDRPGNMHNVAEESYRNINASAHADYPKLTIALVAVHGPLEATSSHKTFALVYDLTGMTADTSQKTINDLMWQVIQRLSWLNNNRGEFVYKNTRPLTKVTLLDTPVGIFESNTVPGFSIVSKLRIDVHVQNSIVSVPRCDLD